MTHDSLKTLGGTERVSKTATELKKHAQNTPKTLGGMERVSKTATELKSPGYICAQKRWVLAHVH
jgi:hypothetical protein